MIRPPALKNNDIVGIVAPGRKLDAELLHAAARTLESWGLKVNLGRNILSSKHSYLSGLDSERIVDLQAMLDDPSVKAIICARGGYGTTRILDQLDFNSFLKNPKWICGFSDITALQLKLLTLGVHSIHGTMPVLFLKQESAKSIECLRSVLFGKTISVEANYHVKNRMGEARGQVVGGNLSLVVDSLGTYTEIDTENKILVLEEIDEYMYRLDRMMVQLKRAKKLQQLAGLVVGYMSEMKEGELPFKETVEEIILHHVGEFDFPVAFNFPIGHENPNLPWIQGSQATLHVKRENSVLDFD